MKPIKAAETGSDAPAAPPSFLDSLKAVDVSSLDRLIAIRQENERIAQYRAKADEKKKDVAEAVYARVSQDYAKRTAALEQQSAPLRTQARAEYRSPRRETAHYLLGEPMLGDLLADGLDEFGVDWTDGNPVADSSSPSQRDEDEPTKQQR